MNATIKSVCPYCGVGCGLLLEVADGQVRKVSGDPLHPSNAGRLCTKGLTCAQPLQHPARLSQAQLRGRRDAVRLPVLLDSAIASAAARLRALIDSHGPDAVAFYVSGQMSLEAQYLATKLAKGFIGTNQIESNSRLCMASAASGYKLSLGADAPPGSYDDFEHADLFLVSGANMADCHPVLFLRMMQRVAAGARLIVVDPRRTATAEKAHLHLALRPGSDLALLNGLLHLLWHQGYCDEAFIAAHCEGWAELRQMLDDYPPARVAQLTGLDEADIRQAARWIGEAGEWMSCWTMGLNQSSHGTWNSNALCNLHLATGRIGRPGSGPFSLTGQPNAMGGREMGYMGAGLPGQRSVLDAADRAFVEQTWGVAPGTLHNRVGGGTLEMFDALGAGRIKACWIICSNPLASVPRRQRVIDGLRAAELVIVQDAFLDSETNAYADILLPGALWAEGDGVMINSERNLTLAAKAVEPPGEALPDWQIIVRMARALGYGEAFEYASAAEVFDEIRGFHNPATGYDLRGASHARLREGPLQWPCPPQSAARRHPQRYRDGGQLRFATPSGRARFFARPHQEPAEAADDEYPFLLNTGRVQHQWHTLTKTGRVPTLNRLNPGPFVELNPCDVRALGAQPGDRIRIRSRRGEACLPLAISERVQPGQAFAPFHWNDAFGEHLAINTLTSEAIDPLSLQPELKVCAVTLQRVAAPAGRQVTSAVSVPEADVRLLWASQTGNVEALATGFAERLRGVGLRVDCRAMDEAPLEALSGIVLLLSSSFGDGEAPDNGRVFWERLSRHPQPLHGLRYALLALGDSRYAQFCGHGRQLQRRLAALGAQPLLAPVECDSDYAASAERWFGALLPLLPGNALAVSGVAAAVSAERPRLAGRLLYNRRLNGVGSARDTRQLVVGLEDSALVYQAGDALGVWPRNCPALVEEILERLALDGGTPVPTRAGGEKPLRVALAEDYEIARPTPAQLAWLADAGRHSPLAELLAGESTALQHWLHGRQLADLFGEAHLRCSAEQLLEQLTPLRPRLYSIASSPLQYPREVHLTLGTLRYGVRKGVASTFLADRAADVGLQLFVQSNRHFRLPKDGDTPLIMIGPGTGVAPFRGFLQEREARGDRGRNWLFFGEQQQACDFYYRDELLAAKRRGLLSRLSLAFSRDQAHKIYVQDRMREEAAALWGWLQEGACVYVCGDAQRMARDVDQALRQIACSEGGMDAGEADAYLRCLAQEKRYLRDVY